MSNQKRQSNSNGLKRRINSAQIKSYRYLHRSRQEPYALYDKHVQRKKSGRGAGVRVRTYVITMTVMAVLALIFPLRPTFSAAENRNLASFPTFSSEALADGSYFSQLNTWFADTFPLRDTFLGIQNGIERLYGSQSQKITGEVTQGDEIPVVDTPDDEDEFEDVITVTPPSDPVNTADPGQAVQTEDPTDPSANPQEPDTEDPTHTQPEDPVEDPVVTPPVDPDDELDDLTIPELGDDAVVEKFGAVLSIDNAAYEYYNFVQSYADMYTSAINRAAEQLDGVCRVYSIIVPNSMGICVPADMQSQVNTSDQKAAIKYMNSCFSDKVTAIPVYNTLLKHHLEGEYLFFRSDHHWTALGAYHAYERFARAAGLEATPLDQFIHHSYEGFLGTFYNSTQSAAMAATPDTVDAYEPPSTNTIHITNKDYKDWKFVIVGNVNRADAGNKYATFIGGDNPFSYIDNPNLDDGSAILLIKESYGNAFAPFLVENYQHVYIVDYRYISQVDSRKLTQMCKDLGVRDVLFLNTISTTRSKSLVEKLDRFIG